MVTPRLPVSFLPRRRERRRPINFDLQAALERLERARALKTAEANAQQLAPTLDQLEAIEERDRERERIRQELEGHIAPRLPDPDVTSLEQRRNEVLRAWGYPPQSTPNPTFTNLPFPNLPFMKAQAGLNVRIKALQGGRITAQPQPTAFPTPILPSLEPPRAAQELGPTAEPRPIGALPLETRGRRFGLPNDLRELFPPPSLPLQGIEHAIGPAVLDFISRRPPIDEEATSVRQNDINNRVFFGSTPEEQDRNISQNRNLAVEAGIDLTPGRFGHLPVPEQVEAPRREFERLPSFQQLAPIEQQRFLLGRVDPHAAAGIPERQELLTPLDLLSVPGAGLAIRKALPALAGQLPRAGTTAAPAVTTAARQAPYVGLSPGTHSWMQVWKKNPGLQEEMLEYGRRLNQELPTTTAGATVPPYKGGSTLDKIQKMWREEPPKRPFGERIAETRRKFEEAFLDERAGINQKTAQVRKQWRKQFGEELPDQLNAEAHGALLPGGGTAGIKRAEAVIRSVKNTLGKGIDLEHVNTYLHLRHFEDVIKMKGNQRLVAGGVEGLNGVRRGLAEMSQLLGTESFAKVQQAASHVRDFHRGVLRRMTDSGLVSEELESQLRAQYPWYNPIRYLDEAGEQLAGTGTGRQISVTSSGLRRLSDIGSEAARQKPTDTIFESAVRAELLIRRNDAARATMNIMLKSDVVSQIKRASLIRPVAQVDGQAVFRPAKGEVRGTVSYMEGGKRVAYEVPSWVEREAKSFGLHQQNWVEIAGHWANSPARAVLVTYNPGFGFGNFVFDTVTVLATQGVLPWTTATNLIKNARALFRYDRELANMLKQGADVSGWHGRTAAQIAKEVTKSGNIALRTSTDWRRFRSRPWEFLREAGHALETAPRRAVYQKRLERGSTAQQAALIARRATVDFSRTGHAVRLLNSLFLFLNPAIQGAMLPIRVVRDYRMARWGLAGFAMSTAGLYGWNRQFEEYYDIPLQDRLSKVIVMLPSNEFDKRGNKVPHYVAVVPVLREFAAISAPITHILSKLDGKAPEDMDAFAAAISPVLNPFETMGIDPINGQFLPIPTYLGTTIYEMNSNKDTYRGRDIVPVELQGLPEEEQFDEFTSEVAVRLGQWFGYSPKKIDHLLKTGVGRDLASAADTVLRISNEGADPEVDAIVAYLQDVRDNYPPEDVARVRQLVLSDLDQETRKRVEELERAPEPTMPFASSIMSRFYRKMGGQFYQTGLEQAAKEANIPLEQVKQAQRILGERHDQIRVLEEGNTTAFLEKKLTGETWRSQRREHRLIYQFALTGLGVQFPKAVDMLNNPSARAAFYDNVYTVGGAMKDRRTRADLLLAGLRSIPVPELSPGVEDWYTYFQLRDQYVEGLSKEDQKLLKTQEEASQTPFEREYSRMRDLWKGYWGAAEHALNNHPIRIQTYRDFRSKAGPERESLLLANPWLREVERKVVLTRELMREQNKDFDAFLYVFGYVKTLRHPENQGRETMVVDDLIRNFRETGKFF